MEPLFVNRVANSGLITLNLEEMLHSGERVVYDIKENLFHGLMLREKDFREFVKTHDWAQYDGKNVAIICSADAIVPTWAYMLLATKLQNHAHRYVFGNLEALEQALFQEAIAAHQRRRVPRRQSGSERLRQRARAHLRLRGHHAKAAARGQQHHVRRAVQHRAALQKAESSGCRIVAGLPARANEARNADFFKSRCVAVRIFAACPSSRNAL